MTLTHFVYPVAQVHHLLAGVVVQQAELGAHLTDEGAPLFLAAVHGVSELLKFLAQLAIVQDLLTLQGLEGDCDAWFLLWTALDLSMPLPEEHVARLLHLEEDGANSLNSFKNLSAGNNTAHESYHHSVKRTKSNVISKVRYDAA